MGRSYLRLLLCFIAVISTESMQAQTKTGNMAEKQGSTLTKVPGTALGSGIAADMMVRISEIEIVPEFLDVYNAILKEESSASVRLEPGVIAIFPMYQKDSPAQIRILEIYANKVAYQQHLKTAHFQKYKTSTLKMVKSLKLIDMDTIDQETMSMLFRKL